MTIDDFRDEWETIPEDQRATLITGMKRYDELRETLEANHWNQFVAIDVVGGGYVVAHALGDAVRGLHKEYNLSWTAPYFMRRIGNEPEWGLSARILAGEMEAKYKPVQQRWC